MATTTDSAAPELRVIVEPHRGGVDYDGLLRIAGRAEEAGYAGLFLTDHLVGPGDRSGTPGPLDAWTALAGLARDTRSLRLGVMGSAVTFRPPGLLAIIVAQLDAMSGGRAEVALSTAWNAAEHRAAGIPHGDLDERVGRYEEQLAILHGIWATPAGDRFSYEGRHYRLEDFPALPRPVQRPGPPIIVSGGGPGGDRKPMLAARHAAEFNLPYADPASVAAAFAEVRAGCAAIGRPVGGLRWSTSLTVCCGRDDDEVRRRAAAVGRDPQSLASGGLVGTVDRCAVRLQEYADVGVDRFYLQFLDPADIEHLDLAASAAARVRAGAAMPA